MEGLSKLKLDIIYQQRTLFPLKLSKFRIAIEYNVQIKTHKSYPVVYPRSVRGLTVEYTYATVHFMYLG